LTKENSIRYLVYQSITTNIDPATDYFQEIFAPDGPFLEVLGKKFVYRDLDAQMTDGVWEEK
jgi:hypothetical protein